MLIVILLTLPDGMHINSLLVRMCNNIHTHVLYFVKFTYHCYNYFISFIDVLTQSADEEENLMSNIACSEFDQCLASPGIMFSCSYFYISYIHFSITATRVCMHAGIHFYLILCIYHAMCCMQIYANFQE